MVFAKSIGLLIIILIIQSIYMHWSFLGNIHPDLILVMLVFLAFKNGPVVGVFCGFTIGLIQDVYAVETMGVNALSKSVIGYAIGLFDESRFSFYPATRLVFLISAFIAHELIYNISIGISYRAMFTAMLKESLPAGALTLIVGTIVFYYFKPIPQK
ncbi:rod shape-determining protein MreD [Fibrobacterota bacterium]